MARKAKINRPQLLLAALVHIDEKGIEALSMRRLGQSLGVEAMSLYNHVEDKEAVLDGVHQLILESVSIPERGCNWRRDIESAANNLRSALNAHPNALILFVERPAITHASIAYVEWGLEVLSEVIPQALDRMYALRSLLHFVIGHCMTHSPSAKRLPDFTMLPATEFPQTSSVLKTIGHSNSDLEFELGLTALLEAIERRCPY